MVIGLIGGIGSGKSSVSGILKNEYGFEILKTDDIAKELRLPDRAMYMRLVEEFGETILEEYDSSDQGSLKANIVNYRPIDNRKLAALIYSDSTALKKVNDIVHPAVWNYVEDAIHKRTEACKAAQFKRWQCSTEDPHKICGQHAPDEQYCAKEKVSISNPGTVSRSRCTNKACVTGETSAISNPGSNSELCDYNEMRIAVETALPGERFTSICNSVWYVYADRETRIKRLMESRGFDRARCEEIISEQKSDEEFMSMADDVIDNSGSFDITKKRIGELIPAYYKNCAGIRRAPFAVNTPK